MFKVNNKSTRTTSCSGIFFGSLDRNLVSFLESLLGIREFMENLKLIIYMVSPR